MIASLRMPMGMLLGWMLLAGMLRAQSPASGQSSSARPSGHSSAVVAADTEPDSPRKATDMRASELRGAVRTALRRESSSTGREQVAAIHELLALYRELAQPGKLERDERIQLRGTIRSRLTNVSRRISRQVARDAAGRASTERAELPADKPAVLAQQIVPAAGRAGVVAATPGDSGDLMAALSELIRDVIAAGNWADPPAARQLGGQQVAAQQVAPGQMAGPGMAPGGPGGPGGLPKDLGADLVELIQQTIAPDTWEVNGGQGSIVYFGPLQAIVVRQTDEVHDNLRNLIGDLRN